MSIAKAGATAAVGSLFAAVSFAAVTAAAVALGVGAAPMIAVVSIVIGGFILAATLLDFVDNTFEVKTNVAKWAR